jgi:AraC-like DNA-binding protein
MHKLEHQVAEAESSISYFVERFWKLTNSSEHVQEIVVIPDGRVDVIFCYSSHQSFHTILLGLESKASKIELRPKTIACGISFKLPAVELLFENSISALLNNARYLPEGLCDITQRDLDDFEAFCNRATLFIKNKVGQEHDARKRKLFNLIYLHQGLLKVEEVSNMAGWSSRQINRYFTKQFGMTLKAYCNILRFKASFLQLKQGKLYPEQNYSDQAHFTREVKKLAGVVPKELAKNKYDRFVQFSTITGK